MNKLFLGLLFFNLQTYAKSSETVVLLKELSTNGKLISKDVAVIGDKFLMVNKEKLSPVEIITHSKAITNIARYDKINQTDECKIGTFIHLIKFKNNIKSEEGCLESQRFKSLKASFRSLKKNWIMEND